jgi:hypothetical protein
VYRITIAKATATTRQLERSQGGFLHSHSLVKIVPFLNNPRSGVEQEDSWLRSRLKRMSFNDNGTMESLSRKQYLSLLGRAPPLA